MWKIFLLVLILENAAFYYYYRDSQATIAILNQNNAKLEVAVQTNEAAIQSLQENYAKANQELGRVNDEFRMIRAQNEVLADKLAQHDLGVLGSSKPGLVTRVINNASEKAMRCFELLSGAELSSQEKEATSGQAFNSECPWLYTAN